jgi:hypothetical protein
MKLSEIYQETLNEGNIWRRLESILKNGETLTEGLSGGLEPLLTEANIVIFKKFQINPKQKVYFISGSARLYLYPDLIAELNKMDAKNFPLQVGDLDLVIPNEELWKKAGLGEFLKNGIYRPYQLNPPATDMNIEAFTVWAPNRTPGYENIEVRSEQEIFNDLEFFEGYWFMGLEDVIDYKDKMKRDKEIALSELIRQYEQGGGAKEERSTFLNRVAGILTGKFEPNLNN